MSQLIGNLHLRLNPPEPGDTDVREGFSAVAQVGRHLFAACDETSTLERLTYEGSGRFGEHRTYRISELLDMPDPDEEVDLEGIAWASPYLWVVGSHSRRRGKPKADDPLDKQVETLASVDTQQNRYVLGRIPVHEDPDGDGLVPCRSCPDPRDPTVTLTAARLTGEGRSNALMGALADDAHLRKYMKLPSKDNGFDVEGLALAGDGRLFLGLRGPVLNGWAVVLELEPREDSEPGMLRLRRMGPNKRRYRKHFLQMDGLGVRDLCGDGEDLLVLAGPTMDVRAPAAIYRWKGALLWDGESMVHEAELEKLVDLPHDVQGGHDHPEGICMLPLEGMPHAVLVVYDSAAKHRIEEHGVRADVFGLEGAADSRYPKAE